jgi:hypothetical protein
MKEHEMYRACCAHRVGEKCVKDSDWKSRGKETNYSKDLDVDGRIILRWVLGK